MSNTDKFEKFRVMAARWRSLISDSNTPEVNAALKDSADFMDKLIAQKEAEQDERRKSDMENLTSAIQGLKEVITILNERVGSAPKVKASAPKKSKPEVPRHKYGEYGHVLLSDEEYSRLTNFFREKYGASNSETVLKKYIADVDNYVESKGKPYKGYCQTIKNYHSRDVKNGKSPLSGNDTQTSHSYDPNKLFEHALNTVPTIK